MIYDACVLSVLLYGSESWPVLRRDEDRLDRFHHQCIRAILGVSRIDQETDHITNSDLRVRWGSSDLLSDILRRQRMQWLGHGARMPDYRLPKQLLFGWLPQTRPAHGPRLRWKDRIRSELTLLHVPEWYKSALERQEWRSIYLPSVDRPAPESAAHCNTCNRTFTKHSGLTRHKCLAERRLPVELQRGARHCSTCRRWFKSAGGLAVHRCQPSPSTTVEPTATAHASSPPAKTSLPGEPTATAHASSPPAQASVPLASPPRYAVSTERCCGHHCSVCGRCCKSASGFGRHNCRRGGKPVDRGHFST